MLKFIKGKFKFLNITTGSITSEIVYQSFIISDSINEFKLLNDSIKLNKITNKDKVFITKNSNVPSLLVSRLNIPIKRSISPDKCSKIIVNDSVIPESYPYYIVGINEIENNLLQSRTFYDTQLLYSYLDKLREQHCDYTFYIAVPFRDEQLFNCLYNYPTKIVYEKELIKYIFDHTEKISEEEYLNCTRLLSSNDKSNKDMAFELLQYYDLSDVLYDLLVFLRAHNRLFLKGPINTTQNYILSMLDIHKGQWIFNSNFYNLYENILSGRKTMDNTKEFIKKDIIKTIKQNENISKLLNLINCDISIYDKDGETAEGDRSLEEE